MTREEAIKRFRNEVDKKLKWSDFSFDFEMLLCSIYDDFENRTCENCKHWDGDYCHKLSISFDIGGCGYYFEKKEEND